MDNTIIKYTLWSHEPFNWSTPSSANKKELARVLDRLNITVEYMKYYHCSFYLTQDDAVSVKLALPEHLTLTHYYEI